MTSDKHFKPISPSGIFDASSYICPSVRRGVACGLVWVCVCVCVCVECELTPLAVVMFYWSVQDSDFKSPPPLLLSVGDCEGVCSELWRHSRQGKLWAFELCTHVSVSVGAAKGVKCTPTLPLSHLTSANFSCTFSEHGWFCVCIRQNDTIWYNTVLFNTPYQSQRDIWLPTAYSIKTIIQKQTCKHTTMNKQYTNCMMHMNFKGTVTILY